MGNLPLQREWIFNWWASPIPWWISIIVTCIAFILHPALFGLQLYRKFIKPPETSSANASSKSIRESSKSGTHSIRTAPSRSQTVKALFSYKSDKEKLQIIKNLGTVTTLVSIAFGWIASIVTFLNTISVVSSPSSCEPITILQNICWLITKLTIYHVLLLRLQSAFWGSTYNINPKMMLAAYIFVTGVCLVCIIGSIFDVTSVHFVEGWCLLIIPTWLILLPCALDVVCSVFVTVLFLRVLNKVLLMNQGNIAKNNKLMQITVLMTKLVLLTLIAVLSNLFGGIWFAVTDIALFTYLDTLINPICLILMEANHMDVYRFCCKCCHIGMHRMLHRSRPEVAAQPFVEIPKVESIEKATSQSNKENATSQDKTHTELSGNASPTPEPQLASDVDEDQDQD